MILISFTYLCNLSLITTRESQSTIFSCRSFQKLAISKFWQYSVAELKLSYFNMACFLPKSIITSHGFSSMIYHKKFIGLNSIKRCKYLQTCIKSPLRNLLSGENIHNSFNLHSKTEIIVVSLCFTLSSIPMSFLKAQLCPTIIVPLKCT